MILIIPHKFDIFKSTILPTFKFIKTDLNKQTFKPTINYTLSSQKYTQLINHLNKLNIPYQIKF